MKTKEEIIKEEICAPEAYRGFTCDTHYYNNIPYLDAIAVLSLIKNKVRRNINIHVKNLIWEEMIKI